MMDLVQALSRSPESKDRDDLIQRFDIANSRNIKDCNNYVAMLEIMLEEPRYRSILLSQDQFNTLINLLNLALERYRFLIKAPAVLPRLKAVFYELENSESCEAAAREDALPPEGTPEVEGGHPEAGAAMTEEEERDEDNERPDPGFDQNGEPLF